MVAKPPPVQLAPSTVFFAVSVAVALVAAILLALSLLGVLIIVFLAIILAETMRPLVAFFEARRVPRPLAILVIFLVLLTALVGSVALIVPPLVAQANALFQEAPAHIERVRNLLPGLNDFLQRVGLEGQIQGALGQLAGQVGPVLRTVVALPAQVLGAVISVFSVFVLAIFWIGLTEDLDRNLVAHLPPHRRELVRTLAANLSMTLGGWLRGQLVLMLFVGVLSFLGLAVLGVRYPLALAVWAGVTEVVPFIGPWIGAVPAVLVGASEGPTKAGLVFLLYLGVQQVENNLLVPKVMQHAVGLHPFVVLVALLIGGSLLGIGGVVIAVPAAAAIKVLASRFLLPRLLEPLPASEAVRSTTEPAPAPADPSASPADPGGPD